MTWISIVLWLLTNLPDLISLILGLFNRTRTMSVAARNALRLEIEVAIKSPLPLRERRRLIRQIILREMSAES